MHQLNEFPPPLKLTLRAANNFTNIYLVGKAQNFNISNILRKYSRQITQFNSGYYSIFRLEIVDTINFNNITTKLI